MNQTLFIIISILGGLLFVNLICLFFISRKSQHVMRDLLEIMTNPEQAKIQNATRVLEIILKNEITKINDNFKSMANTLQNQIEHTEKIKATLGEENDKILNLAEDATKKISNMSSRLDNTIDGLGHIVESSRWNEVQNTADNFLANIESLLNKMKDTSETTTEKAEKIQEYINTCVSTEQQISTQLNESLNNNTNQMNQMNESAKNLQQQLADLSTDVANGFSNVKTSAAEYDDTMRQNDKMLKDYLKNLSDFNVKTNKEIRGYTNSLKETADLVYSASRLEETSLDKHLRKLEEMKTSLDESTQSAQKAINDTGTDLTNLANTFKKDISEFSNEIVQNLHNISNTANETLEKTNETTNSFTESVKSMGGYITDIFNKMTESYANLTKQSEQLISISSSTKEQLEPLSALIERYYKALPDLSKGSQEMSENVKQIVDTIVEKIDVMKSSIGESLENIKGSSVQLSELSGQSRQQMIDLMKDYTKAVEAMQSLNKQMMIARASAPMDAIKVAPTPAFKPISTKDFMDSLDSLFGKLYTQSVDLTRSIGADIPPVVWKKYNDGDDKIFAKWLVKMFAATDKKQIKDLLKTDKVFNSQATQFIRNFEKILNGAKQTDNAEKVITAMLKTDLGIIYNALHNNM